MILQLFPTREHLVLKYMEVNGKKNGKKKKKKDKEKAKKGKKYS